MAVKVKLRILPEPIKTLRKHLPDLDAYISCIAESGKFEYIRIPENKISHVKVSEKCRLFMRLLSQTKHEGVITERYLHDRMYVIVTKFEDYSVVTITGGHSV